MAALDDLCINTIRFLAVDAVQKANSGHPGAPMGAAPIAYVLWDRLLKYNPRDPSWPDRDRFILSAGHASALLYALLHLTGYDLSLDDIKQFRQWDSRTAGHPEYGLTPGVEMTTGPLGQGFAGGVGMAIAERRLAARYNRPDCEIVDHYTYAIVSDGDLMEGVASEAASIAGTLGLSKLIYLYDDNDISIEGSTDMTFTENVGERFKAYGWHVAGPIEGLDIAAIEKALWEAQEEKNRPSLIICRTVIGYGSPHKAGTASAHGEPLGVEETVLTKQQMGWPVDEPFTVPQEALTHLRKALQRGAHAQEQWSNLLELYREKYPDDYRRFQQDIKGELPDGWDKDLDTLFTAAHKPTATRAASGTVLNSLAPGIPALFGGSADLAPSNKTLLKGEEDFGPGKYTGRNIHFGVREHAMGALANGMALHGGIIPYTGTFLVFYDYMRPAVRLAALMGQRVIFIFSHDSIGLGEDGPTHQPVEHILGLRSVPNLVTIRPADATETVEAWKLALMRREGPTALVLSRQDLPVLDRTVLPPSSGVYRGAYVLRDTRRKPDCILIGTGSEVHIALEASQTLDEQGIAARVISMPSWELFDEQPADYRMQVFPPDIKARVSIEAGTPIGWERYVGLDGKAIGLQRFGASAPQKVLYEKLGFTAGHIAEEARRLVGR
jgi:transketolase